MNWWLFQAVSCKFEKSANQSNSKMLCSLQLWYLSLISLTLVSNSINFCTAKWLLPDALYFQFSIFPKGAIVAEPCFKLELFAKTSCLIAAKNSSNAQKLLLRSAKDVLNGRYQFDYVSINGFWLSNRILRWSSALSSLNNRQGRIFLHKKEDTLLPPVGCDAHADIEPTCCV